MLAGWTGGEVAQAMNFVMKGALKAGHWLWVKTEGHVPSQGYIS